MLDREACERRVYRLATLLTGDRAAATRVITEVLGAQPDLRRLDGAHMDRLTVLRCRERPPRPLDDPVVPAEVAGRLAALPAQAREAWIFRRVYRLDDREMARAMDCSTTAGARHLDQADAAMAPGGDPEPAAAALRTCSLRLDVPAFYRRRLRARRRVRLALLGTAVLLGVIAIIWAVVGGPAWLRGGPAAPDAPNSPPGASADEPKPTS